MTIATKPVQKENEENKVKDALSFAAVEGSVNPELQDGAESGTFPVESEELYQTWRRRRLLTSLCISLLMLWLIMAGVIGGVVLFKYFHQKPVFHGWCGAQYMGPGIGQKGAYLQEQVEVDPNAQLERIQVPKFGFNRPAVFIHDFRQNVTAIVDRLGDNCFIRDLDRTNIAHPDSFMDLVRKMETGYYDLDPEVVREEYRVRMPAMNVQELVDLDSTMVTQYCSDKHTYWLQKQYRALDRIHNRNKRSSSKCNDYGEINGKGANIKKVFLQRKICFD